MLAERGKKRMVSIRRRVTCDRANTDEDIAAFKRGGAATAKEGLRMVRT